MSTLQDFTNGNNPGQGGKTMITKEANRFAPRPDSLGFNNYFGERDFTALKLGDLVTRFHDGFGGPITAAVIDPHSPSSCTLLEEVVDAGLLGHPDTIDLIEVDGRDGSRGTSSYGQTLSICNRLDLDPAPYRWFNPRERELLKGQLFDLIICATQSAKEAAIVDALARYASLCFVSSASLESKALKAITAIVVKPFGPVFAKSPGRDHCIPLLTRNAAGAKQWCEVAAACESHGGEGCNGTDCPAAIAGQEFHRPPE
jgi:hypothetical protein